LTLYGLSRLMFVVGGIMVMGVLTIVELLD
jgi:hypothetical protein